MTGGDCRKEFYRRPSFSLLPAQCVRTAALHIKIPESPPWEFPLDLKTNGL
jgi:hypothetical protein